LRRGGTIKCRVTDRRRRSPLEQGGLEVPCELIFVTDEATQKAQKGCIYTQTLTPQHNLTRSFVDPHNHEKTDNVHARMDYCIVGGYTKEPSKPLK